MELFNSLINFQNKEDIKNDLRDYKTYKKINPFLGAYARCNGCFELTLYHLQIKVKNYYYYNWYCPKCYKWYKRF
jgi:hypothetical protein